jgi:PIN domain nuclease of toxin-antitoxin system
MPSRPARKRRASAVREGSAWRARRLLLDTHVWLWWQLDHPRLGPSAREAIAAASEVRLSVASVWEMSIKSALGKLSLPKGADIMRELELDGFLPLSIELEHAVRVAALPALPALHRDPFDRMLVAQAMLEGLTLVTADLHLAQYGARLLDASA